MEATANFTKHMIPSISNLQISAMQIFEMSAMYLYILESVTFTDAACMQLVWQLTKLCLYCYKFQH